jgi:glycosyltransferase involved in cell wall biosynthesis
MNNPAVSIIIPTRNRRELLGRMLDSLARVQAAPGEMEVLIVDDGSTDGTAAALAARRDPFPLRVVHQAGQGPAAARNRGAAEARGEILGFLDSDILVSPGWWRAAAPHFQDPRTAAVEGATLPPDSSGRPTPFTNFVSNSRGNSFQSCNFLCRREAFQRVGGFDERFCQRLKNGRILHHREDTDLAFSLLDGGWSITFEPCALVWHPLPAPDYRLHWHKARFGLQEALLRRKHPKLYARCLKWIDGRAFPVFYWGWFAGVPLALAGMLISTPLAAGGGELACILGWVGSIYALCRKRWVSVRDLGLLSVQMLFIPWVRLYWVLRGEWLFRGVSASPESKRRAIEP